MPTKPEAKRSTIAFEIPESLPFLLQRSGPYSEISWPTTANIWETISELRKVAGIGKDKVTLSPEQIGEQNPVRLGRLKNISRYVLSNINKAEIVEIETSRTLYWERNLDRDNLFMAVIHGHDIPLRDSSLQHALVTTTNMGREFFEPLIEEIFG
jgi:hypothetical protein